MRRLNIGRDKIAVIAASALALVLVLIGIVVTSSQLRAADPSPDFSSAGQVSSAISIFLKDAKQRPSIDYLVFFNRVRLEPGPKPEVMYASGPEGEKLLVMVPSKQKLDLNSGELFDVHGVVQALPNATTMRTKWKLSKAQIAAAREHGIYILAEKIVPEQKPKPREQQAKR